MTAKRYYRLIPILLALVAFVSCESEITEVQSESFMKFFGSAGTDRARGVAALSNGGYAICGTDSTSQGTKMILVVTDAYGNTEPGFPKYYPQGNQNAGANTIVTKNGGQNGFIIGGYIENAGGDRDLYLVYTKPDGSMNWERTYGSAANEEVLHAAEGLDKFVGMDKASIVLAGYQENQGVKDIMIMGVTEQGDSMRLGLLYTKPPEARDASANFILNTGTEYLCVCTYNKHFEADTDIMLMTFDEEFSPIVEPIPGQFDEMGKCIVQGSQDSCIVLGNSNNTLTRKRELLLHLVLSNGPSVKESTPIATISDPDADLYAERIVKVSAGRFAIVGTRVSGGDRNIFVQFLEDYRVGDRIIFGSAGNQSGADIAISGKGGLIIAGDNEYEGNSMITLIKTDDSGNF